MTYNYLPPLPPGGFITPVYAQYANARRTRTVIDGLVPYLTVSVEEFFANYFNINTCNQEGLDNWGVILDVPNYAYLPTDLRNFGFDYNGGASGQYQNFENGSFYSSLNNQKTPLAPQSYRALLKLKYSNITTNGTMNAINAIMEAYVKGFYGQDTTNECIVLENIGSVMAITYYFNYPLQSWEFILLQLPHVLPTPLGVSQTINTPA